MLPAKVGGMGEVGELVSWSVRGEDGGSGLLIASELFVASSLL